MEQMPEKFSILFQNLYKLFYDTMKNAFIKSDAWEDIELKFFLSNITEDSPKLLYEVKADCKTVDYEEIRRIGLEENINICGAVKERLKAGYKGKLYICEADSIKVKESKWKLFWAFVLMDEPVHGGQFFLENIFSRLGDVFKGSLLSFEKVCHNAPEEDPDIQNSSHLAQKILKEAAEDTCNTIEKLFAPFETYLITALSGEYYEKRESSANLVFLPQSSLRYLENNGLIYNLTDIALAESRGIKFIPSNIRAVRKLAEIAHGELYLVFAESEEEQLYKVYGICRKDAITKMLSSALFLRVVIRKHMWWDLFIGNSCIFSYINGQFKIDKVLRRKAFSNKFEEYFGKGKSYSALTNAVMEAVGQQHGTMLVVLEKEKVKLEADRLGNGGYGLNAPEPRKQKDTILNLSAIDGSIFLDTEGKVYGIGMIIDGIVPEGDGEKGNMARGSRYNSSIKYLAALSEKNIKGMIIVVSEDGSVDIMTSKITEKLAPQSVLNAQAV